MTKLTSSTLGKSNTTSSRSPKLNPRNQNFKIIQSTLPVILVSVYELCQWHGMIETDIAMHNSFDSLQNLMQSVFGNNYADMFARLPTTLQEQIIAERCRCDNIIQNNTNTLEAQRLNTEHVTLDTTIEQNVPSSQLDEIYDFGPNSFLADDF